MEPERPDPPRPEAAPRNELRALVQLRDRVEAAAREVTRLREENAALSARVAALQAGGAVPGGGELPFPVTEDPEKLKAQLRGFIEAVDRVLAAPESAGGARREG